MKRKPAKGSVLLRIVLIYFILVFIAMTIVSVYIIGNIEDYQLRSLKQNIETTLNEGSLLSTLGKYNPIGSSRDEIQRIIDGAWTGVSTQEISVVARDMLIVASSNSSLVGKSAAAVLDANLIASVISTQKPGESTSDAEDIEILNLVYPIENTDSRLTGVVFVRADLSGINSFLQTSRGIFIRAMVIALAITVIIGFILARSITVPINNVTETVIRMSQGDFSAEVPVKSNDEIGQLAEMFNMLRKRLDTTLNEISNEKNKLGTILEYMADGLIAIDLDGKIIHANPAAREMLDVMPDADLSKADYGMLMGRISEELSLEKVKENCKEEGAQGIFEQNARIFAIRYDRFKDELGKDIGIILIIQDVTERQKLEDMQTDFVANVSHELKTPLTNIKSYTETLIDGALEDKETAEHFLGIIDSEADRMNRLVKDLLQLSRLDHDKEILNRKDTNAVVLIDTAVTKVELTASAKNQQLNRLYDRDADIRVNVDRDRFEQVILNVLTNAIKYTNDGGRIDVDVFEHDGFARIIVQDNGIGINPESLPRIFERFYRVDKARSRAMGCTGLGLAITKQIVEGHDGTISAESAEGKGTKMIIEIPLSSRKGIRNIE